jgi:hypothetical protein
MYNDDFNGLLFNTIFIDSWEEKLFLYVLGLNINDAMNFSVSSGHGIFN